MKKAIVVFSAFVSIAAFIAGAYNNGKGAPKETVGIIELPSQTTDSLIERGKQLTAKYNHQDLQAVTVYLHAK